MANKQFAFEKKQAQKKLQCMQKLSTDFTRIREMFNDISCRGYFFRVSVKSIFSRKTQRGA